MRRCRSTPAFCLVRRSSPFVSLRHQHAGLSKDTMRTQPNADPASGKQMAMLNSDDMSYQYDFQNNNLEHVSPPELSMDERHRSDLEREERMRSKYGALGPGEKPKQNSTQVRRDMLQAAQDIDGLPWEVRWKKSLIPTAEEVIQEIRDRVDLYVMDPIEREVQWYLHWKDRGFRMDQDRLIWPQGFADFLDQYDEYGRRRTLPTDQRWSDTSWKYLADTNYKNRMWMVEGENRKMAHMQMQEEQQLLLEEDQRATVAADLYYGMQSGVVDLDPDQTYQALSGTADPQEVAKTKQKILSYTSAKMHTFLKDGDSQQQVIDPISGFPKSELEPLPTGITVEQAAKILQTADMQEQTVETQAELRWLAGKDPSVEYAKLHKDLAKKSGDRPALRTMVEGQIAQTKQLQRKHEEIGANSRSTATLLTALDGAEAIANESAVREEATQPKVGGFVQINQRPPNAEPDVARDLYNRPKTQELEEVPEWYDKQVTNVEPLIQRYGIVGDPIESAAPLLSDEERHSKYYQPPEVRDEDSVINDTATGGVSAFDEAKVYRIKSTPELTKPFKPLPMYKEVRSDDTKVVATVETSTVPTHGADGKPLKRSERLRLQRLEKLRKSKEASLPTDADITLPSLPWETDSIHDPYRGVAETDLVAFDKAKLEKTWATYRGFLTQSFTEFGTLQRTSTNELCMKFLQDAMQKVRDDDVGDHPDIPIEQLEVLQIVFEAHFKKFLADSFKFRNEKLTESKSYQAESDEMLRRASAKAKLIGKNFVNFVQEMTSIELDQLRRNPIQRYSVMVRDPRFEVIARPFSRWLSESLNDFAVSENISPEQVQTQKEFVMRVAKDARYKVPQQIEGIPAPQRDGCIEALHQWCLGLASFYSAKHYMRMLHQFGEARFRAQAESAMEDALEYWTNATKCGRDLVTLPIPDAEPPYEYTDKEFLDGENAVYWEMSGAFDLAESIWHSGTTKRWYPVLDETEYLWYLERRGRYSMAIDVSDRCLENLNKKSHPSICPFPERARPFLEGAPLTQETAEHLWMRYMGDVYSEHAKFQDRMGKYATARNYREKSLNLYHLAIRTAKERLPASWKAPLLTEAKYLMKSYGSDETEPEVFLKSVEIVLAKMYAMDAHPPHWVDNEWDCPTRIALLFSSIPAFGELINKEAAKVVSQPTEEEVLQLMAIRAKGGAPSNMKYLAAADKAAEVHFRAKIMKYRSMEIEGSLPHALLTHLYFSFRTYPENSNRVQQYWDMYEPVFLHIYTNAALGLRSRGVSMLSDAIRRMSQILSVGSAEHRKLLMVQLVKVRDQLPHFVSKQEIDRAINTLEAHMADAANPLYIFGTQALYAETIKVQAHKKNDLLRIDLAAKDYAELTARAADTKERGQTGSPSSIAVERQRSERSSEDGNLDADSPVNLRTVF